MKHTDLKRTSNGRIMMPFKTKAFIDVLTALKSHTVQVPLEYSTQELMFNFKTEWESSVKKKFSDATFFTAVGMLVDIWAAAGLKLADDTDKEGNKSSNSVVLTADQKKKIADEVGLTTTQVTSLFDAMQRTVSQNLVGTLITPSLLKTSLGKTMELDVDSIDVDLTSFVTVRSYANRLYDMIASHSPFSDVVAYLRETVSRNRTVIAAYRFIEMFRQTGSINVPVSLFSAYSNMTAKMKPGKVGKAADPAEKLAFFSLQTSTLPLIRSISDIKIPDLHTTDILTGLFTYLRIYMGSSDVSVPLTDWKELNFRVKKDAFFWPELPSSLNKGGSRELTPSDEFQDFMSRLYLLHMLFCASLDQRGPISAYLTNFLKDRKYNPDDQFNEFVIRWIDALSLVLYCFDCSVLTIANIGLHDDVFDSHMKLNDRSDLMIFVSEYFKKLSALTLNQGHPRFLMQPGLLLTHLAFSDNGNVNTAISPLFANNGSITVPNYGLKDDQFTQTDAFIMNPDDFSYTTYRRNAVRSGMMFEAPVANMDMRRLMPPFATKLENFYFLNFPFSSVYLASMAFDFRLRKISWADLQKEGLTHFLENRISLQFFMDAEDVAKHLRIPLSIAQDVFKSYDEPIPTIDGPLVEYIIWDRKSAPVYEVSFDHTEGYRYDPFVGDYPFFLEAKIEGIHREINLNQGVDGAFKTIAVPPISAGKGYNSTKNETTIPERSGPTSTETNLEEKDMTSEQNNPQETKQDGEKD